MRRPSPFARLNTWVWRRIAASAQVPDASLGIFRWLYCLYLLAFDAPHFAWLDRVPAAFFDPQVLSPAFLLGTFPAPPFFTVLDTLLLVSLCLVAIGYRTQVFTALLLATDLVGQSFGGQHIALTILLACMLVARWGEHYSLDARRRSAAASAPAVTSPARAIKGVSLFAALLAFGFLTAGLPKLLSWVDLDLRTSGVLSWYYPNLYTLGRSFLLAPQFPTLPPLLFEAADYAAAAFEVSGFVFLLRSPIAWRIWLIVGASFHLANALFLGIQFNSQALSYVVFADLAALSISRFWRDRFTGFTRALAVVLAVAMGAWHVYARWAGVGSTIAFLPSADIEGAESLIVAVPVFIVVLVTLSIDLSRFGLLRRRAVPAAP